MNFLISAKRLTGAGVPSKYAYLAGNFYYNIKGRLSPYDSQLPRFCIFAQGRSGSTLLTTLLDQHSTIKCEGEVLSGPVGNAYHFCQGKSVRYADDGFSWGFKVKYYQLTKEQKVDPHHFLKVLTQNDWKVIYLKRENFVLQALSTLVGNKRNNWTYRSNFDTPALTISKVSIDTEKLSKFIYSRQQQLDLEAKYLNNVSYCPVIYEKDLEQTAMHQSTASRIFDFLGLPDHDVTAGTVKVGGSNLSDYLLNYEEVYTDLERLGYSSYLSDF